MRPFSEETKATLVSLALTLATSLAAIVTLYAG